MEVGGLILPHSVPFFGGPSSWRCDDVNKIMHRASVSITQLLSFSFDDAFQLDDGVVKTQRTGLPMDLTPGWTVAGKSLNSFKFFISHLLTLVM